MSQKILPIKKQNLYKKASIKRNKYYCNCICCKFCNENWTEYRQQTNSLNINEDTQKKIRFRKKYYCDYNCNNCIKYIHKKKEQWKMYVAASGTEALMIYCWLMKN